MKDLTNHHNQIDAVITWVDGSDMQHYKKRQRILAHEQNLNEDDLVTGHDETRFEDNGEISYCIRSIRTFAPWINRIYLVTDNQKPSFLTPEIQKKYNVHVVDHKEIFEGYHDVLPTFNSRTIETTIWRIPGLAPRFIYFNDDFIVTRPVQVEDFFVDDKVVLRGEWNKIRFHGRFSLGVNKIASFLLKKIFGITRSYHLLYQIRAAKLAGFKDRYYRIEHVPHPVKTQTIAEFFETNNNLLAENIQYRFRNTNQFSAIIAANHLEIKNSKAYLKAPDEFLMLNGEIDMGWSLKKKLKRISNDEISFICLQGFEKFSESNRLKILTLLDDLLSDM